VVRAILGGARFAPSGREMGIAMYKITGFCLRFLPCVLGLLGGSMCVFAQAAGEAENGAHDFDFNIGTWKTHISRLQHPLTGSKTWIQYEGTSVIRKVWDGRANLVELEADSAAGHIEALSLRLYNPQSHQWSLNFSNSAGGTLGQPTIGGFKNGRGEFTDQETWNGRAVWVRFIISNVSPLLVKYEQAFSADGGKTWEVNWIAEDTREAAR